MDATLIDDLARRVERLLLRHEELRRTQALLEQEVRRLTEERDHLLAQCRQARARLAALAAALDDAQEAV
ncbi:hypothetical protein Tsedi_00055 [Tepidimonas sediminis]|uniref:Uncharacterized protein n=1 Tax=Tepidimonas sediminis TaxID=2588941 RepID=A0A554WUH8_9BURK|nr:DUF904 domain-containing protein [Tepidimonas sediminis]TSE27225.1 hypothetical protein Tsedi_00055 [Tepidimonas sediminis]